MINIVHPKVVCKPPIYKQKSIETVKIARNNKAYKEKSSTGNLASSTMERKVNNSLVNKTSNVTVRTTNTTSISAKELCNCKTSMSDCNQNVIEPDSCSFEQLCSMINELEENPSIHISKFKEEQQIRHESHKNEDIQERSQNEVQPEKDYPQTMCTSNGSAYENIMSFLGTLEQDVTNLGHVENFNSYSTNAASAFHAKGKNIYSNGSGEDAFKRMELNALKDDLATARLQLEEKEATIKILKTELKNERKSACEKFEGQKKEYSMNLQNQKNKYQDIIKRHQKFIEQIITEKKGLTEKCDALAQRIKEIETKHQRDMKVIADRHTVELQRARELCAASEKIRRERWLETKTSKIKEMTVKGLEPELRNMVEQHQREIQDLRSIHAKELQDVELRTIRRTNQQLEQLRLELTENYDKILSEEKEALKKRYQEQLDEQEILLQTQKRKFFNDLQEEKRRFAQEQEKNDKERDAIIQKAYNEYREKYDAIFRKFEADKKAFQEALSVEKNSWIENNQRQYNAKLAMAEARITDECTHERDKQIELAIERLEKEIQSSKENFQKNLENKIRCLTEKYEADLQISFDKEKLLTDKLDSTQKRLENAENELRQFECKFEQCSIELRDSHKLIDKLTLERDNAKQIVRKEIESEKRALEDKIASLYQELTINNSNKEAIMTEIYSRIKLVITQKDLTIKNLLKQVEDSSKKCDHLEQLLDQQRRDYILRAL